MLPPLRPNLAAWDMGRDECCAKEEEQGNQESCRYSDSQREARHPQQRIVSGAEQAGGGISFHS